MNYKPTKVTIGQRWSHYLYGVYRVIEHAGAFPDNWSLLEHESTSALFSAAKFSAANSKMLQSDKYTYLGMPKPSEIEPGQIWMYKDDTPNATEYIWIVAKKFTDTSVQMMAHGNLSDGTVEIYDLNNSDNWSFLAFPESVVKTFGDYCKKCNTFNEYIEKTGAYVCYGCKI